MLEVKISLPAKKQGRIVSGLSSQVTIVSHTADKAEASRFANKVAKVAEAKAKAEAAYSHNKWVVQCNKLYKEWLLENKMPSWHRELNGLDPQWIRTSMHSSIFEEYVDKYQQLFKDWVVQETLTLTKDGDSRSYILRMTRKVVSEVQKQFSTAIMWECNKECQAIYRACRIKNYDKFCQKMAQEVRSYYYPEDIIVNNL